MKAFFYTVLFTLFMLSTSLLAQDLNQTSTPKWELGLGVGALILPHYRGSDQDAYYVAPIPYIKYNGDRFRVDKEGAHLDFYKGNKVKIDASTAFYLSVDSDKNRARTGMPSLEHIVEIGPRIQFNLYKSFDNSTRLIFAIPLRKAIATDLGSLDDIGWVVAPYLQLRNFTKGWESAIAIGPVWADEEYHDYFYQVDRQYVKADRQFYDAKAGYSGSRLAVTTSTRSGNVFFGLFAKYDYLDGAVFLNSPLVKKKDSFTAGIALSYVFTSF